MILKKILAGAVVGSALVLGGAGLAGSVANADPIAPAPLKPGHDDPCPPPWCNNGRGHDNGWHNGWDKGWDKGHWWATNRHDWWDDRNGAPPWGWGPPPPVQWRGAPPWVDPRPINYWGWDAHPVWDDNFRSWGIWLFGVWIPIVGIGVT